MRERRNCSTVASAAGWMITDMNKRGRNTKTQNSLHEEDYYNGNSIPLLFIVIYSRGASMKDVSYSVLCGGDFK